MNNLYDSDFHEWAETQAGLLRNRSSNALDWDNLAEEIEALARNERREIGSRLEVLCQHLLKWQFQREQRSGSWRGSIMEARNRIADVLEDSPTLQPYPAARLASAYSRAREGALAETGLADLPATSPWTAEQVLDHNFWPDA